MGLGLVIIETGCIVATVERTSVIVTNDLSLLQDQSPGGYGETRIESLTIQLITCTFSERNLAKKRKKSGKRAESAVSSITEKLTNTDQPSPIKPPIIIEHEDPAEKSNVIFFNQPNQEILDPDWLITSHVT